MNKPGPFAPAGFVAALFSSLLLTFACSVVTAQAGSVFYVSNKGNDAWLGIRPSSSALRRDGPFRTINRALEAARAIGGPSTIMLAKDTYFLDKPIVIAPENSGLSIVGPARLSGGVRITGWARASLNGRPVLAAHVPGRSFQELWVNGRRATRARQPNTGYFAVATVPDKTSSWQEGQSRFGFKVGELGPWRDMDPLAEVVVMSRWVESHLPIASVDPENHIIAFNKRAIWQLEVGDPYYIAGVAEALDCPGEWYSDSRTHTVYYWPLEGERAGNLKAIAPILESVLEIKGEPGSGRFVENLSFKALTFSHTEWVYPPATNRGKGAALQSGGAVQAAFTVPAGVRVAGARNVKFEQCRFVNLGTYGLELGPGCQSNRVAGCEFGDLAGGGMKIGTPEVRGGSSLTANNEIVDCVIHDGGKVFHSAVGIWIGQSPSNRILHSDIHDFYYTGISIGWTWGYGPALATNNLVAYNHVHHIGRKSDGDGPILSDMGGIYTLGMQPGTRILNNLWHDIHGFRYGGWGIYFDEGSSSIVAASNVVFRTTHGGFHQHYGATNTVVNNVFAVSRDHQLQRSRPEPHVSFFFKTNIVFIDKGVFLGGDWNGGALDSGSNVFFDTRTGAETNATFAGRTFQAWQSLGREKNSAFADPKFKNSAADDFSVGEDSPALLRGFQPISLRELGPRVPPPWPFE